MPIHNNQPNYTIEARSLSVVGVAGHDFWVLRDDKGQAIAELHGLATERSTGKPVPIGTDPERYSLRAWHLVHDQDYANSLGVNVRTATYVDDGQPSRIALSGPKDEVLARWNHAVQTIPQLNAQDLDYPANGFKIFGRTVNSNSTYRTFGEIMDLPVQGFPGRIEPGLDNRMLPSDEIEKLRYRHETPAPTIQREGAQQPTTSGPSADHAALHAMPPTDNRHPDHRYFNALRDALPAHIGDHEVAYVMYKAKQDGVSNASQLDTARTAVSDRTVFVAGVTPGFRSRVELPESAISMDNVSALLNHSNASIAQRHAIEPPARELAQRI